MKKKNTQITMPDILLRDTTVLQVPGEQLQTFLDVVPAQRRGFSTVLLTQTNLEGQALAVQLQFPVEMVYELSLALGNYLQGATDAQTVLHRHVVLVTFRNPHDKQTSDMIQITRVMPNQMRSLWLRNAVIVQLIHELEIIHREFNTVYRVQRTGNELAASGINPNPAAGSSPEHEVPELSQEEMEKMEADDAHRVAMNGL